ncbi:MAG: hypothetical protein ACRC5C_04155 [Bacilli bacterium]
MYFAMPVTVNVTLKNKSKDRLDHIRFYIGEIGNVYKKERKLDAGAEVILGVTNAFASVRTMGLLFEVGREQFVFPLLDDWSTKKFQDVVVEVTQSPDGVWEVKAERVQ